jgi:PPOX class probable F420-dependent enzyme
VADTSPKIDETVERRLRDDLVIWLTTVSEDGTPQPTPVWFLWEAGSALIYSKPNTPKLRNIARRAGISLNLNSSADGGDVVVLTGTAQVDPQAPPADQVAAYLAKYGQEIIGIGMTSDSFAREYSVALRVTVRRVRSW